MLGWSGTATIIGMIPQGTKIQGSSLLRERRIQGSSMGSARSEWT